MDKDFEEIGVFLQSLQTQQTEMVTALERAMEIVKYVQTLDCECTEDEVCFSCQANAWMDDYTDDEEEIE